MQEAFRRIIENAKRFTDDAKILGLRGVPTGMPAPPVPPVPPVPPAPPVVLPACP